MRDSGEAPAGVVPAEPPATEIVATTVDRTAAQGSPLAIFIGMMAVLLASFGGAGLVLVGAGRASTETPEVTPTPTVAAAAARTAAPGGGTAPAGDRVRVVSASGRSRPMSSGTQHEVTFSWTLEGARANDPVVLQFYAGTRALGQQRGTLEPAVFNFSTGTFTLAVAIECSTAGWTAEILTVRGQPIEGNGEATVAGAECR